MQNILQADTLQTLESVLQILLQRRLPVSSMVYLFCLVFLGY